MIVIDPELRRLLGVSEQHRPGMSKPADLWHSADFRPSLLSVPSIALPQGYKLSTRCSSASARRRRRASQSI